MILYAGTNIMQYCYEGFKKYKKKVNMMLNLHNEDRIHQVPWVNLCVGRLPLPQCRIEVTTVQDSLGWGLIGCHGLKKVSLLKGFGIVHSLHIIALTLNTSEKLMSALVINHVLFWFIYLTDK